MLATFLLPPVGAFPTLSCNGSSTCPTNATCLTTTGNSSNGTCECDDDSFALANEFGGSDDASNLSCIPVVGTPCDDSEPCPEHASCQWNYSLSSLWRYCQCPSTGYTPDDYQGDLGSCTQINECSTGAHNCDANAFCTDSAGSFYCTCSRWGYAGNGVSCTAVGECELGLANCAANAFCNSTETSHECSCPAGFETVGNALAPTACPDVDECSTGTHSCHANASCANTNGSFTCACNEFAYTGDGVSCTLTGRCELGLDNCHVKATCSSAANLTFACACDAGFSGDGVNCADVDECVNGTHNCDATVGLCTNSFGSFTCECDPGEVGYTDRDGDGLVCEDRNECTLDIHDCDENADCINTGGSFTCECRAWDYSGNGTYCNATGACILEEDNCPREVANCISTETSFTCNCTTGRSGDGFSCVDIDECNLCTNNCDLEAECINTDGSFTCDCNQGYEGNGTTCVDVCTSGNNTCHVNATCFLNADDGTYTCGCDLGFYGTGVGMFGPGTNCSDVLECGVADDCDPLATCAETWGSFACTCNTGFSGAGTNATCVNDLECESGVHTCAANATCTDTFGSFECSCWVGFEGNGSFCPDVDECVTGNNTCARDSVGGYISECTNTEGSFTCACMNGFNGSADGTFCADFDECGVLDLHDCDENANCTNTFGSFTCACNAFNCSYADTPSLFECGYAGNGTSCEDINECGPESANVSCMANATCFNTAGSFFCSCALGYFGPDERTCAACPKGEFKDFTGNGSCLICPEDTFQSEWGATAPEACVACPAFSDAPERSHAFEDCLCRPGYEDDSAASCRVCDAGYYKVGAGAGLCVGCAMGKYSTVVGAVENATCETCPAFSVSLDGSATLDSCKCDLGYLGADGATCTACPVGTYKATNGSAACSNCPGNFYSESVAAVSFDTCVECVGNSLAPEGSGDRKACGCVFGFTDHRFGFPDQGDCAPCYEGTFKNFSGPLECTACPANAVSPEGSASISNCSCDRGYVGDGLSDCVACPANQYKDVVGIGVCLTCPTRAVSTLASDSLYSCFCDVGTFGPNGAACGLCVAGTFKSIVGSDDCEPCTPNSASPPGSSSPGACTCVVGFSGSGDTACVDEDECALGDADCDALRATCNNTQGSFTCACNDRYVGNGTDCVPEDILLSLTLAMDPALFALNLDALRQFFADLAGVTLAGVQVLLGSGGGGGRRLLMAMPNATNNTNGTNATNATELGNYTVVISAQGADQASLLAQLGETALNSLLAAAGLPPVTVVVAAYVVSDCGNGLLEPSEVCDDGNDAMLDGCSDICRLEVGWACNATPGVWNASLNRTVLGEDPATTCVDVNECLRPSSTTCDDFAFCVNSNGSFSCRCHLGFSGDGAACFDDPSNLGDLQRDTAYGLVPTRTIIQRSDPGYSYGVAVHKTLLLVSTLGHDHVHLYQKTYGVGWPAAPHAVLTRPATGGGDLPHFGTSIALHDAFDINGEHGLSFAVVGTNEQRVYVFGQDAGGAWGGAPASVLEGGELNFGSSVAASSTRILVGAYGDHLAFLYERNADKTWRKALTLDALTHMLFFGHEVAMTETHLVVGALYVNQVVVFGQDGDGAFAAGRYTSFSVDAGSTMFGASLSITDKHLFVGAPGVQKVFVFSSSNIDGNTSWPSTPNATLAVADGQFGYCVSNSDLYAVVGAFRANAAYIFKAARNGTWDPDPFQRVTQGPGVPARSLGFSCALTNHDVILGSYEDDSLFIHSSGCQPGYYGQTIEACLQCPVHTRSLLYSRTLQNCTCGPGYYGTGDTSCVECPEDFFCPGGAKRFSCLGLLGVGYTSRILSDAQEDCTLKNLTTRVIGQSTVNPGQNNTLSVTLQANVEFFTSDNAVVTITGLLCGGSSCSECNGDLSLDYTLPTAGVDVYHTPTYRSDGSLELAVIQDIAYNETVVFSFCLVNPLLGQFSPSMTISGSGVDFLPAAVVPAPLSGSPLSVLGFDSAHIIQSNPAQETANSLTARLALYASVASGYRIQFSNLTGISSASGNRPVTGGGYFAPLGYWNASTQIFTVFVERDMPFGVEVAVQFSVTNGNEQQISPAVSVAVLDELAETIIQTRMTTGVGNAAVLNIAGFSRLYITQSSVVPGSSNNLTVSLASAVPLTVGVRIIISGLRVLLTPSNPALPLWHAGPGNGSTPGYFGNFLEASGEWDKSAGTLRLRVTRATTPGQDLSFYFAVTNGLEGQASPDISIETTGLRMTPQVMDTPLDNRAPLLIGGFRTKAISQSTVCPGRVNTITITLSFFVPIPWELAIASSGEGGDSAPAIGLSGLTGSDPDSAFSLVYGVEDIKNMTTRFYADAGGQEGAEGENVTDGSPFVLDTWNASTGLLDLFINGDQVLDANTLYIVRLTVVNGPAGQHPPNIKVFGLGQAFMIATPVNNQAGDAAALRIAGFDKRLLTQTVSAVAGNNTLTLLLSFFSTLPNTTVVNITGLTGSQTPSDAAFSLVSQVGGGFGATASWMNEGVLVLTANRTLLPSYENPTPYAVSFLLWNPLKGQDSPAISLVAWDPAGSCNIGGGGANESSIAAAERVVASQVAADFGADNTAPLLVADLATKLIRQANASVGADNLVSLELTSRGTLRVGTTITVSGMFCYRCGCAECCRLTLSRVTLDGVPIFTKAEGDGCESIEGAPLLFQDTRQLCSSFPIDPFVLELRQEMRKTGKYIFEFALKSTDCGQNESPDLRVAMHTPPTATGPDAIRIEATAMTVGARHAAPLLTNYFFTSMVNQSSSAAGVQNTIGVQFSTRAPLSAGSAVRVTGLLGGATPDGPVTLFEGDADLFENATWVRETGALTFFWAPGNGSEPSRSYSFFFLLKNPDTAQDSPAVAIQALDPLATTLPSETDKGLGPSAPLLVNEFRDGAIGQATARPGAENTITVTFSSVATIFADSYTTVTLTGLTVTRTADQALPIAGDPVARGILPPTGVWAQATGSLAIPVITRLRASEMVEVSFGVVNPLRAQRQADVDILSSGIITAPRTLANDPGFSAPLLVWTNLTIKTIEQSTASATSANTISVTLSFLNGIAFDPDLLLTISGLTGSVTSERRIPVAVKVGANGTSEETFDVAQCLEGLSSGCEDACENVTDTESCLYNCTADCQVHPWPTEMAWDQTAGALVLASERYTMLQPGETMTVSFNLTNPSLEQSSPEVSIRMTDVLPDWVRMDKGLERLAPLEIAGFLFGRMSQSTAAQGVPNALTLQMVVKSTLPPGSTIAILGLTGPTNPSGPIPVVVAASNNSAAVASGAASSGSTATYNSSAFGGFGVWDLGNATLTFTVVAGEEASRAYSYVFSFELTNPQIGQASPAITLSGKGDVIMSTLAVTKAALEAAPLLVIGFVTKAIGQSDPAVTAQNVITVTIMTEAALLPNTLITISGLTGSASGQLSMPILSESGLFHPTGVWSHIPGTLVLGLTRRSVLGVFYTFSFEITNPEAGQDAPSPVTIESSGMVISVTSMQTAGGNAAPLLVARVVAANVAQTDPGQDAANVIVSTFAFNVDLVGNCAGISAGFQTNDGCLRVSITNLIGSQTSGTRIAVDVFPDAFAPEAVWNRHTGSLELIVTGNVSAGAVIALNITLKNSRSENPSPVISIKLDGPVHSAAADMVSATGVFAPLRVVGFSERSIRQSSVSATAVNTLTFSFRTSLPLPEGVLITLTGLTGSQTNASSVAVSVEEGGTFNATAVWDVAAGQLILEAVNGTEADTRYTISLDLVNPILGQAARVVLIESDFFRLLPIGMENAAGNAAPLLVASFDTRFLYQTTPATGALNTLYLTLLSNVRIGSETLVTLTGLFGVSTPDNPALPIHRVAPSGGVSTLAANLSLPFNDTAVWDRLAGTLILAVLPSRLLVDPGNATVVNQTGVQAGVYYGLAFNLTNGVVGQDAQSVSIEASGTTLSRVPVAPGARNAAPLLVAAFVTGKIGQSTPSSSATGPTYTSYNEITVTFVSNFDLTPAAGSTITIRGLSGTALANSAAVRFRSTVLRPGLTKSLDALFEFGDPAYGVWNQTAGSLVFVVIADTVGRAEYEVRFTVINPLAGRTAATVYIEASGIRTEPLLCVNGPGNRAPLKVAGFTIKAMGQSTPSAMNNNTLTATLATNVVLEKGTYISISGLTGTLTPDGPLPLSGPDAATFSGTGYWRLTPGIMVFPVAEQTVANQSYVVSFRVVNSPVGQDPPTVLIRASRTRPVGAPVLQLTEFDPVTIGESPIVSATGNARPLLIASFTTDMDSKAIGQITPHAFSENTITITLGVQSAMPPGAQLTIRGLTGSTTPSGLIPLRDVGFYQFVALLKEPAGVGTHKEGMWDRELGQIVIEFKSSTVIARKYIFSFNIYNPGVLQAAPPIYIEISGLVSVTPVLMHTDVGNRAPMVIGGFTTRAVAQSTPSLSSANTITVTLISNIDYKVVFTPESPQTDVQDLFITISGLVGTSRASTPSMAITAVSASAVGLFRPTGVWDQATGTLIMEVLQIDVFAAPSLLNPNLAAGVPYVFSFAIVNAFDSREYNPMFIQAAGTAFPRDAFTGDYVSKPLVASSAAQVCTCNFAPGMVAGFTTRKIGQLSPSNAFDNIVSITLLSNVAMASTTLRFSGLTGTDTPDRAGVANIVAVPIEPGHPNALFNEAWNQTSGVLLLEIVLGTRSNVTYVLSYPLRNKATGQEAVTTFISSFAGIDLPDRLLERGPGNAATLLVNDFLSKEVRQATPSTRGDNVISVKFQTRAALEVGTVLSIAGLVGSLTPSGTINITGVVTSEDSPSGNSSNATGNVTGNMTGNVTGNATVSEVVLAPVFDSNDVFGFTAQWFQASGTLLLLVLQESAAKVDYAFDVTLRNPAAGQRSGDVTVGTTGPVRTTVVQMERAAGNAAPMLVAGFMVKGIGQNTPNMLAENTLTVTLSCLSALPPGTDVVISGLTGATSDVAAAGNFTTLLEQGGGGVAWNASSGELRLSLQTELPPDEVFILHVNITNPGALQESPSVSIETRGAVRTERVAMDKGPDNEAPLLIAGFLVANSSQSVPDASTLNTISVTLQSNAIIREGSTLVFSWVGLTKAGPADANTRAITSTSGAFSPTADWFPATEMVKVPLVADLAPRVLHSFTFTVMNPVSGQRAPEVSLGVTGATWVSPRIMQTAGGYNATLLILSVFTDSLVSQSTSQQGVPNTLTIKLTSRDKLSATDGVRLTLVGLTGTNTPGASGSCGEAACLDVASPVAGCGYRQTAGWNRSTGALTLAFDSVISAGLECLITVTLDNPAGGQDSPAVSMQANYIHMVPMTLARAARNAAPLLVADFLSSQINQSNAFVAAENTMHVSFKTRVDLLASAGSSITIEGLTGSVLPSNAALAVCVWPTDCPVARREAALCCDPAHPAGNNTLATSGAWNAATGTLVVSVVNDLLAQVEHGFSFTLENPETTRSPVEWVRIRASGVPVPTTDMTLGAGDKRPLLVAGFIKKFIGQATTAADGLNTIFVTLASQAALGKFRGVSSVVIEGLVGGIAPDGRVPIRTTPDANLGNTARWIRSTGTLFFDFGEAGRLEALVEYVIEVSITNPPYGQDPATDITVAANGEGEGVAVIPGTAMTVATGNAAPFLVADFLNKTIGQSTTVAGAVNTISVTLSTRVVLPGRFQTKITIAGLTGSGTPGANSVLPLSPTTTPFGSYVRWYQASGKIVLTAVGDDTLARQLYVLHVDLQNGPDMQEARNVTLQATYLAFEGTGPLTSKVRMDNAPGVVGPLLIAGFDVREMSHSSASFNASNRLALVISTNIDVAVSGLTVLVAGLSGTQTPSGSLAVDLAGTIIPAAWNYAESVLRIPLNFSLAKDEEYTLEWDMVNGLADQKSPNITVSATGEHFGITLTPVDKPGGNANPLKIVGWLRKTIAQSTTNSGAANTLTVTISLSGTLATGTDIAISGLMGVTTPAGALALSFPAAGSPTAGAVFGGSAAWDDAAGTVTLTLAAAAVEDAVYVLAFTLANRVLGQTSQAVSVAAAGVVSVRRARMDSPPGNAQPLGIAGFEMANVSQSTPSAGAVNTFTLSLATFSSLRVSEGATVTLQGLVGAATPSGTLAIRGVLSGDGVTGVEAVRVLGTSALWSAASGSLVITIRADSAAGVEYRLQFDLRNPTVGQESPALQIWSSGTVSARRDVERGSGNQAPLLVAFFQTGKIGQSTASQRADNTISVNLGFRTALEPGTLITITGLTGSVTSSTSSLPVSAATPFSPRASWARDAGVLVFTVLSQTAANATYELRVVLRNPAAGQVSPAARVTSSGVTMAQLLLTTAAGNARPLLVAGFTSKGMNQPEGMSDAYAQAFNVFTPRDNLLTLTFTTTSSLLAGSTVIIDNLAGSALPSTATLPVSCAPAGMAGTAAWEQAGGELRLGVGNDTLPATTYTCSVTLKEPAAAQSAPALSIRVEGTNVSEVSLGYETANSRPLQSRVFCFEYPNPDNGFASPRGFVLSPGTVTVVCAAGFGLSAGGGARVAAAKPVCLSDGMWSIPALACTPLGGSLVAWGRNDDGQLGTGSLVSTATPTGVLGISGNVSMATGGTAHSLALHRNGTVLYWGMYGSTAPVMDRVAPGIMMFPSSPLIAAIASGSEHSLALSDAGVVYAWGEGLEGQLGRGAFISSANPAAVAIPGGVLIKAIGAGWLHSLAVARDGSSVWAWGANGQGEVGINSATPRFSSPQRVLLPSPTGGYTVLSVAAGQFHSLALLSTGKVLAWGYNNDGELGDGSTISRRSPVEVRGLAAPAVAIFAGSLHSAALLDNNLVQMWGYNANGQLGLGTRSNALLPRTLTPLSSRTVLSLSLGWRHSLAVLDSGEIAAWGHNSDGQLAENPAPGGAALADRLAPLVSTFQGHAVLAATAAYAHSLAVVFPSDA